MILPQIFTGIVFLVCLYSIFTEKLNRTIITTAGAVAIVILGKLFDFYSEEQAVQAIDFNTLGLLLGMMILVTLLEPTGFFQYLAVRAAQLSKGRPMRLLLLLGTVTTVLSMFLDNVTTVVLIAPLTVMISEILGLNPTPLLIAEALLSNTGGTATLVGDPPNILIASVSGFSFLDFLTHSLPVVVVAWLVALLILWYLFRSELSQLPKNAEVLLQLNPGETLSDRLTLRKVLLVLAAALLLLLFQEPLELRPSFIALGMAAGAFVWIRPEMEKLFKQVEWNVLIFFSGLFVIIGGLEASGLFANLTDLFSWGKSIPPVVFGLMTLWVSAVLSAFVDNVPITIAIIPVIQNLEMHGVNVKPLWWALVFGAGFGGNATIIGSTANIVVASISERTRAPITSGLWNKRGLPVMIATCIVASIFYVVAFPLFRN